jgi:uncharacterized protein
LKRIGLLSDTHGHLDEAVYRYFAECNEVWHAGDIGTTEVSDKLAAFKPFKAVYGNIDGAELRKIHPEVLRFKCEETEVLIIHIGGFPGKYSPEARKEIIATPPKLFICGHSHILKVLFDKKYNLLHMNPGAAGNHGFHKVKTLLRFTIDGAQIKDLEAIEIGKRG